MSGPLQGLKIFDLTYIGVGPWATMILAAMGANVIKVEDSDSWAQRQGGGSYYNGLSIVYMHCQLGKKGVFLDLKATEGQGVAWRLLKDADIFLENMKRGTVERLGLGYEEVSKINPGIIYGNCTGFGSTGALKDWPSSDAVGQAFTGPASITGKKGGKPEFIRWYALYDYNASSYIVTSALLGILNRERTGHGPSMIETL